MLVYMTVSAASDNGFSPGQPIARDVLYGRAADAANCSTLKPSPPTSSALCPTPGPEGRLGIDRIINNTNGTYQLLPAARRTRPAADRRQLRASRSWRSSSRWPSPCPRCATRPGCSRSPRTAPTSITAISRWQFQPTYPTYPPGVTLSFVASKARAYGGGNPVTIRPLASFLRAYQLDGGYTPGPLLAALTAAGAIGSLLVFTRRVDPAPRQRRPAARGAGPPDRQLAAGGHAHDPGRGHRGARL